MAWHNMKSNDANYVPRRLLFFDTETRPMVDPEDSNVVYQSFRLGCCRYGRYKAGELQQARGETFFSVEDFWAFVESCLSPRDTLWMIAHNLFFDLRAVLFDELFERCEYVVDAPRSKRIIDKNGKLTMPGKPLAALDQPPRILGMRHCKTGSRIVAVDTFNWFKSSVADLGKTIGLPKYSFPDYEQPDLIWAGYCYRDVEIIERAFCQLIQWCEQHKCGMFRYSAAGQAMAAFRHRFKRHQIVIHDVVEVKALERDSYFAGQSECYRTGKYQDRFYHLDVTSLFPSVMIDGYFPRKLLRFELRPGFLELQPAIDCRNSIAEVMVKTAVERFPVRYNGRPVYPVGWYRTVLCGAELCHAIDCGLVTHWKRWAEYDTAPIFSEYVKYFWNLREQYQQSGNETWQQFAKMMLNTLYGKFAQRLPIWEDVPGEVAEEPFAQWNYYDATLKTTRQYRSVGWQLQENKGERESPASLIAVSSFVTALARERMRQLRNIAGQTHVYYQAVDSLIVDQIGMDNLQAAGEIAEGRLGKLRLLQSAESIEIIGVGDYAVGDNVKLVGRKQNAIVHADGSWTQAEFDGPGSLFRGLRRKAFAVTSVTKRRLHPYIPGKVDSSGVVWPLELGNGDCDGKSSDSCK